MAIVYEHVRNDTNEVFYVGIGENNKRAYSKYNRNPYWHNIVNKHGYTINIIHTDISWKYACEIEKELIAKYGRKNLGLGNLVNCTDGGFKLNPNERRKLTYEECKKVVSKYESYSELYNQDVSVLMKIQKKGWNELISHWELPFSTINIKWTYERCKEEIKKYKYLKDLQSTSLLASIRRNGWYNELTVNLIRELHPPYTKEEVIESALKYKTRNDFRIGAPGQYASAKRLGIMSEAISHMGISLINKQYTKQEILNSASKYTNQRDWSNSEPSIFRCARGYSKLKNSEEDKAFFRECISHMQYISKPNGYWTYEKAKEVALKYKTLKEFRENLEDASVYKIICKYDWRELLEHMEFGVKPKGYWTYEKCKEIALKYKSLTEFSTAKNDCTAYAVIRKNGWNELLKHIKKKMTLKKRHIYAYEFHQNKVAYIGLTCDIRRRHEQHLGVELNRKKSPVLLYIEESGETPIHKVLTRRPLNEQNAPQKEDEWVKKYKQDGWIMLNKAKAGSLGRTYKWKYEMILKIAQTCKTMKEFNKNIPHWNRKNITEEQLHDMTKNLTNETTTWTHDNCKEVAIKCRNKSEFQKKYSGAYKYAIRTHIISNFFPHTQNDLKKIEFNDYDKCIEIALKYNKVNDFKREHNGYYRAACNNGWMGEIKKAYQDSKLIYHTKPNSST
jgi:hypothetical protein